MLKQVREAPRPSFEDGTKQDSKTPAVSVHVGKLVRVTFGFKSDFSAFVVCQSSFLLSASPLGGLQHWFWGILGSLGGCYFFHNFRICSVMLQICNHVARLKRNTWFLRCWALMFISFSHTVWFCFCVAVKISCFCVVYKCLPPNRVPFRVHFRRCYGFRKKKNVLKLRSGK